MGFKLKSFAFLRFKAGERPSLQQVVMRLVVFILFLLSVRWFFIEPFVVPSGSMFPNLLVSDYILVSKLSTGVKIPTTQRWLWGPKLPARGEIVVFKSKGDGPYFVKRLIGWPGDKITMVGHRLAKLNGQEVAMNLEVHKWEKLKPRFDYDGKEGLGLYSETLKKKTYLTMYTAEPTPKVTEFTVPQGELFFMGDHRSGSSDSRDWGTVPARQLVGPVWRIFLSCDKKSPQYDFCDLRTLRWNRLFSRP